MDEDGHPLADDEGRWQTVVEESETLAEEYEQRGWTVCAPVPGDVVPLPVPGDGEVSKIGFDVLVSGEEFETLESLVADADFAEFEAYRAQEGSVVYLTLAFLAPDAETAVVVPLYYTTVEAERMLDRVRAGDPMRAYFHPLSGDRHVEFDLADPRPAFPPEDVA